MSNWVLKEFLVYQRGHPQAGRRSRGWCSRLLQATWLRRWSVGPMPLRPWHMLVAAEESFHSRTESGWGSSSLSEYGEWSASHAPSPPPHIMILHTTANPRTLETPQPAISYNYNCCINNPNMIILWRPTTPVKSMYNLLLNPRGSSSKRKWLKN